MLRASFRRACALSACADEAPYFATVSERLVSAACARSAALFCSSRALAIWAVAAFTAFRACPSATSRLLTCSDSTSPDAAWFIASEKRLPAFLPADVAAAVTPLLSFAPNALRLGSTSIHAAVPAMRPPHCSVLRLIAQDKGHELVALTSMQRNAVDGRLFALGFRQHDRRRASARADIPLLERMLDERGALGDSQLDVAEHVAQVMQQPLRFAPPVAREGAVEHVVGRHVHDQRMQGAQADEPLPELPDRVARGVDGAQRGLQLLRVPVAVEEL